MINLKVLHGYAFGGDEEEIVPATRRALKQIFHELTQARKVLEQPPLDAEPKPSR